MRFTTVFTRPQVAASTAIALCLPLALVVIIAAFEIKVLERYFQSAPTGQVLGNIVAISSILLLPLALVVSLAPVLGRFRTAGWAALRPSLVNLAVGGSILCVMLFLSGVLVADQLPCWQGVPNCD